MEKKYIIRDLRSKRYYCDFRLLLWSKHVSDAECFDTVEEAEKMINEIGFQLCTIITIYVTKLRTISSEI